MGYLALGIGVGWKEAGEGEEREAVGGGGKKRERNRMRFSLRGETTWFEEVEREEGRKKRNEVRALGLGRGRRAPMEFRSSAVPDSVE